VTLLSGAIPAYLSSTPARRLGPRTPQLWRLARPIGRKKPAAVAVGHSILVIAGTVLSDHADYDDLGDYFARRANADRYRDRLAELSSSNNSASMSPPARPLHELTRAELIIEPPRPCR